MKIAENKVYVTLNINNALIDTVRQSMQDVNTPLSESAFIVNLLVHGRTLAKSQRVEEKIDYRALYNKYDFAYHNAIGLLDEPEFTTYQYVSPVTWLSNLTPDETNFYLFLALDEQED